MRVIAAMTVAVLVSACDTFAPAGPDPSRPSLFGPSASEAPASPSQGPANASPQGGASAGPAPPDDWSSTVQTERGYLQPYPAQPQVLERQRGLLGQDIRQQDTSRTLLQQQLQQGAESDRLDTLRLQQQLEQQRRGW